jgi:SAM-dependent methyltransferase
MGPRSLVNGRWQSVWSQRSEVSLDGDDTLESLIRADGFNTGFGDVTVDAWTDFVDRTCAMLGLGTGDSLFEVGCGAGAFLYLPSRRGIEIAGIDYSTSQIDAAKIAIPSGSFEVRDAGDLDVSPGVDVTIAFSVFQYFSSLDYARQVIDRMCRKATRAVALFDLPDVQLADQALEARQAAAGGADAYAERYAGLDHLSYSKEWIKAALEEGDLRDVTVEPQTMAGYDNGRFRFNAWGWVSSGDH